MGRRQTKWSGGDRCRSGGFLLRIMPPSWQPVPACTRNGHSAGGPFNTATTGFRRRAILLAGTMVLHRFSISSPDLRIDAAIRSKQGQSVHRFSNSAQDLRIDAAKKLNLGQTVHRFSISSLDLRIDASAWLIPGDSPIPRRQTRTREPSAPDTKKESRLIAESGLSKRGSYLLSHLV